MRVVGRSLGSQGATAYETAAGLFLIYRHSNGDWLQFYYYDENRPDLYVAKVWPKRRDCIAAIEYITQRAA